MDRKLLQEFINTFMFLQRFGCTKAIEAMFDQVLIQNWKEDFNTNKMIISSFLRINYQFKEHISNYPKFLEESIKYLESQNYEPKKLLHGII